MSFPARMRTKRTIEHDLRRLDATDVVAGVRNRDFSTREVVESFRMTVVVNALNLPAVTAPVGVSEGMPQAVQIIGPPFAEMRCLAAAEALKARVDALTPRASRTESAMN